jgi:hypothetical protein
MAPAPAPAPAFAPAHGVATVAFLRPSGLGSAITFMIIDHNGRFLGDSTAGASFSVQLPPGEYLFIAEGENTAVMHANLGAERLYYIEVVPKMGLLSARVGLEPIKPGTDAWRKLPETIPDTTRLVPLFREGQAAIDATPDVIQKRIATAKEKWAGYSPAERVELGLEPADGIAGQAPPGAPIASPPPPPATQPAPAKAAAPKPAS